MGFPVMVVSEPLGSGIGSTNNGGASVQVRTLWSLPSRSKEGVIRHSFNLEPVKSSAKVVAQFLVERNRLPGVLVDIPQAYEAESIEGRFQGPER